MRERYAGREHESGDARPVDVAQVGGRDSGRVACAIFFASSSNATTSAPPASRALALASPDAPSPNSATLRPTKVVIGITAHLSFSVESPASASTIEMIQKRITICGSVQPFCSK